MSLVDYGSKAEIYEAVIPKAYLESGLVEYYVQGGTANGGVVNGPTQCVTIVPDDSSVDPQDIGILATGDYFYDIQYFNGKVPSGYTITSTDRVLFSPLLRTIQQ